MDKNDTQHLLKAIQAMTYARLAIYRMSEDGRRELAEKNPGILITFEDVQDKLDGQWLDAFRANRQSR